MTEEESDINAFIAKQKLVASLIFYCHERNKMVIAEGVKTVAELKSVLYLHVDYMQGFFFVKAEGIQPKIDLKAKEPLLELIKQMDK